MTRLEMLKFDVAGLSAPDLARFQEWFDTFAAQRWDDQIDADIGAGRLAALADAALANFRSNRARRL